MNVADTRSYYDSYVTVYESMGGWKAVMVWWNPEGFFEPWQTGVGCYGSPDEAEVEARSWAQDEGLLYRRSGY